MSPLEQETACVNGFRPASVALSSTTWLRSKVRRVRNTFAQSRDCANVLRNLEIGTQFQDSENVLRNLKIAQIPKLRGTYSLHGWFDDGRHTNVCTSPYLLCTQLMHASLQCLASIVHENRISANIVTDGMYV